MSTLPELTEPRDIVPIAVADGLVASARFDLALLAESVQRAEAEAEELERLVATTSSTVPPDEMVIYDRLSGYFDQQALELDARRNEMIDRGRVEAEARLARANEEAARLLGPTSEASPADGSFVSMLTLDALPPATEAPEAPEVTEPQATEPEVAAPASEFAEPEPEVTQSRPDPEPESEFAPPPVATRAPIEVGPVLEAPAVDDPPVIDDPPSAGDPALGAPLAASPFAPVADAPVADAPTVAAAVSATPAAPGSAVDTKALEASGLDLTEFPDLLPILDAMLRGEPVPSAGAATSVAAPEAAPEVADVIAPEVDAAEAEAFAAPEIANIPAPPPAPAPAAAPADPLDHEARFSNFWEEQQAVEAKRESTSIRPSHLLLPMVVIVLVVTFLLVWIG